VENSKIGNELKGNKFFSDEKWDLEDDQSDTDDEQGHQV